jgi:hypothetical protein
VALFSDDSATAVSITLNQTAIYNSGAGEANGPEYANVSAGSTTLTASMSGSTASLLIGTDIAAGEAAGPPRGSLMLMGVG